MLKLAALDMDDLTVISACMQDSVIKTGEISYSPSQSRIILPVNRFVWEKGDKRLTIPERRRSVLHFDRITGLKSSNIDRSRPETVLSILAITFQSTEAPAGSIEIAFAGGAALKFDVECIEAQLADLGPAWAAKAKPKHGV